MKKFFLILLFSVTTFACGNRTESDQPKVYTYDAKVDLFCEKFLMVEKDNVGWLKDDNMDIAFDNDTKVEVTFTYTGKVGTCAFLSVKKIKIIDIKKL